MSTVILPPKRSGQADETWTDVHSIVITGANGSGKTRFGVWIEEKNFLREVHRIGAQRALHLPDLANPMPYERAASQLHYGWYEPGRNELEHRQHKLHRRWGGQPVLQMLSDYELVVSTLFADEARRNRKYTTAAQAQLPDAKPPECSLDVISRIWALVFPHRELVIEDDRISARIPSVRRLYSARMMSDGERVAFYLIGQVLCAPKAAIVVIDEPEIHLHRAIQCALWDEAEKSRPDCTFVYITHDLEFAGSRSAARKVFTRTYDGTSWEWDELDPLAQLPDELVFQVLGNRRPVLFVEGTSTSLDLALYRALYPAKLVFPLASCKQVIDARRGIRNLNSLHNLAIDGLVDRDHRSEDEIAALRADGILVADIAEVENLFCIPAVLRAAAKHLNLPDPEAKVQAAQTRVLSELQKGQDAQVAARALAEIQFRLNGFGPKAGNADRTRIQSELTKYISGIDVARIFDESAAVFANIIAVGDYDAALRYYNCKGNVSFVASALGVNPKTYCTMVTGIVQSPQGITIADELRSRIS